MKTSDLVLLIGVAGLTLAALWALRAHAQTSTTPRAASAMPASGARLTSIADAIDAQNAGQTGNVPGGDNGFMP